MSKKIHHIISAQQFSREWLEKELFPLTKEMEKVVASGGSQDLAGKRMITLFYEPSTRTKASFEIAMDMLGGRVVFSTENAGQSSSAAKGESLQDTIRTLNRYRPDIIILRHSETGAAELAAQASRAPVINAGDGTGEHPTQALQDLYTIYERFGTIEKLSIGFVGDIKRARQVHSLVYLLSNFPGITLYFISSETQRIEDVLKQDVQARGLSFFESDDLQGAADKLDVLYMIRPRKEYGKTVETPPPFIVTENILGAMKKTAIIMSALPRNEEIPLQTDRDSRALYLAEQIDNGLFVRMALLQLLLTKSI